MNSTAGAAAVAQPKVHSFLRDIISCLDDVTVGMLFATFQYVIVWAAIVRMWRSVMTKKADAASLTSLTYCASAVLWCGLTVMHHRDNDMFPDDAWKFHLPQDGPTGFNVYSFLAWTGAYFATDLYFDYDPRFVTHHVLSLAAMTTTFINPHLQGTFAITAFIAELGGVLFHISKLVKRDWMTVTFLVVYTTTRIIMFPMFVGWLFSSFTNRGSFSLLNLWAAVGTTCLVGINVNWCFMQWRRFLRGPSSNATRGTKTKTKTLRPTSHQRALEANAAKRASSARYSPMSQKAVASLKAFGLSVGSVAVAASGTVLDAASLAWDMMS